MWVTESTAKVFTSAVKCLAMDAVDRKIIDELASDARISATELARRLPLSVSATGERVRQLQRSGVIRGYTVVLDAGAVERPIEALIEVRLGPGVDQQRVDVAFGEFSMVTDAWHLTGRHDVMLRVACRNVAELDELLIEMKESGLAEETNTRLILRTIDGFPRLPSLA